MIKKKHAITNDGVYNKDVNRVQKNEIIAYLDWVKRQQ